MTSSSALVPVYLLFTWLLFLHTMEEIRQGVFDLRLGKMQLTKGRYLTAASFLSLLNLTTLGLILFRNPAGKVLGIFMAAIPGVLQGIVHTVGYLKSGKRTSGLGVGFYSAIPLSVCGAVLLFVLLS